MGEFTGTPKSQYAFEGATQNYRLEQKGLLSGDADTLAARELQNLWQRSHHLCRNSAIAITAKKRLLSNWIGEGITVRWTREDGTSIPKIQKKWDAWIRECNADNYGNFYNMETILAGGVFEGGEAFARMIIGDKGKSGIPLKLQILEAEYLDPLFTNNGNRDTQTGITFKGVAPDIYHFFVKHPGAKLRISQIDSISRVAIPAINVAHVFDRERPGQWRGIPHLSGVLLNIYETDEIMDATLQRQKAAQVISWFVENTSPTRAFAPGAIQTVADYTVPADSASSIPKTRKVIDGIAGGVHYLESGEKVTFADVQDIGTNLHVFLQTEWGLIASALGLATHQITGDLSEVNFSSIRAGLNELKIRIKMFQQNTIINLGLLPIAMRWLELFSLYNPRISIEGVSPKFGLPRVYGVDELKDGQADLMEVQAGFAPLVSKIEERGYTFEEVIADRDRAKKAGIIITSIPETMPGSPPQGTQPTGVEDQRNTQPVRRPNDSQQKT